MLIRFIITWCRRLFNVLTRALKQLSKSIPSLIFGALFSCVYGLLVFHFSNPIINSTKYTNIGFAIFAALASVCFSWKKALDRPTPFEKSEILKAGEYSFFGAVCFLMASLFKLSQQYISHTEDNLYSKVMIPVLVVVHFTLFSIAFFSGGIVLMKILGTLYGRFDKTMFKEPDDEILEEEQNEEVN